mmetsp:Transcript_3247/g.3703  ORF Transcript_3247/g.3703 Transcript_3247/m.3703 type:complete len:134 (-) Transcript_3247:18-419(-)
MDSTTIPRSQDNSLPPTNSCIQKKWKPLRIRAGDVAGFCGFNPFSDLPAMVSTLLYQGAPELKAADTLRFSISWVDPDVAVEEVIQKAGPAAARVFDEASRIRRENTSQLALFRQKVETMLTECAPKLEASEV